MPESGAKVIWGIPWRATANHNCIEIIQFLKPACSEDITIYVAADDYFELFVDGEFVIKSKQSGKTESIIIKVEKCKSILLEFRVERKENEKKRGGLIYQVHQN